MTKPRANWIIGPDGKWTTSEPRLTEFEELFHKVDNAMKETFALVTPILKAGGAAKPEDRQALRQFVFSTLLEKLRLLSKDEMHALLVSVFADRMMQDIESRPWGGESPDLLSGK